jgi:malate synthase
MSAYIPIKGDARANEAALAKVREDKEREAGDGHDGTWLAHPDLVPVALEVFDRLMPAPNQVGMEDAATAEICRAQVWQWLRSPRGVLRDGRDVEPGLVRALLREELAKVRRAVGDERYAACRYYEVSERFEELAMSEGFEEFLTLGGYEQLE